MLCCPRNRVIAKSLTAITWLRKTVVSHIMQEDRSPPNMMPIFNELRMDHDLTDAIIKVSGVEFQVHKVCLSCIPYFRSLFTHWSPPEERVYELSFLSADIMRVIIDYVYTGSLVLTDSNVHNILEAVYYINYKELLDACSNFLIAQLNPGNCINTWKLTSTYYLPRLCSAPFSYILEHFEQVAHCSSFLELSMTELTNIISKDSLMVQQESAVYESVIRWISHSPVERQRDTHVLMSKVRLLLIEPEYMLANVLRNELVCKNSACLSIVQAAKIQREILTNESGVTAFNDPLGRPRLPPAILLVIGGWSERDPTNVIEAYDVRADRWTVVENNSERPRAGHSSVFLSGYVYCIGGLDWEEYFNSVRRFNPITHTWKELAPMYYRRAYVSVTALNGLIYAMGGFDGQTELRTAEYYNPDTNQWHLITPMHEQRNDASCTTFQGKIYICGGHNGSWLQSAEFYTPETNHWTLITPMNSLRSGLGVIVFAGRIYAVGGFDGEQHLRSAEAYNPQTHTWQTVSPMVTPRSNFGLEVIEDKLIVAGGFNAAASAESYQATTNEWKNICSMRNFCSEQSCCVISRLPNMEDYAYPREGARKRKRASESSSSTTQNQRNRNNQPSI